VTKPPSGQRARHVSPGYYIQWAVSSNTSRARKTARRGRALHPADHFPADLPQYEVRRAHRHRAAGSAVLLVVLSGSSTCWITNERRGLVGLIALAGLDAETGFDVALSRHAWDKFQAAGRLRTPADLHDAIIEGAVQRIRPKIMTVCAILFGLLPIMWSPTTQAAQM